MTNILEEVDDGENDEKSLEKLVTNDSTVKSGSDQNDNVKKTKAVKDQWGNIKSKIEGFIFLGCAQSSKYHFVIHCSETKSLMGRYDGKIILSD